MVTPIIAYSTDNEIQKIPSIFIIKILFYNIIGDREIGVENRNMNRNRVVVYLVRTLAIVET